MCFHNFSKLRSKKTVFGSGNGSSVKKLSLFTFLTKASPESKINFSKRSVEKLEIKNISKNDSIWKYSNPITSQNKSNHYLGKKRGKLYRSTNKNKKYMIYDDIHHKFVSFGQMKYEDFTKHKSRKRRKNYLTRSAKIRGNWRKNPFSANNLSRIILW
jgi:hypothetical protein